MAGFLKWANNVIDQFDDTASERLKGLRTTNDGANIAGTSSDGSAATDLPSTAPVSVTIGSSVLGPRTSSGLLGSTSNLTSVVTANGLSSSKSSSRGSSHNLSSGSRSKPTVATPLKSGPSTEDLMQFLNTGQATQTSVTPVRGSPPSVTAQSQTDSLSPALPSSHAAASLSASRPTQAAAETSNSSTQSTLESRPAVSAPNTASPSTSVEDSSTASPQPGSIALNTASRRPSDPVLAMKPSPLTKAASRDASPHISPLPSPKRSQLASSHLDDVDQQKASEKPAASVAHAPAMSASPTNDGDRESLTVENKLLRNDLQEMNAEISALRKVWHESRAQLAKAKDMLVAKEEQYKKALRDKDEKAQLMAQEQKDYYEQEMLKLKRTISQNHQEFEDALQAKASFRVNQERAVEEAKAQVEAYREEIAENAKRIQALEQERDEFIRLQAEQLEMHSKMLKQLREEELKREQVLEKEKQMHSASLHNFQSRETSLEADNVEYVNALAAAQRTLEEKSAQLQRVLAEKRWIEADQQALQDQLAAAKSRLELEQKQALGLQSTLRQQLTTLNAKVDELQTQVNDAKAKASEEHLKVKELESKIAMEEANPLHLRVAELEKRLRTMADHLLNKNSEMDRLASERASLRLQLENEVGRVQVLEKQLRQAREQQQESDDFTPNADLETGFGVKRRGANPSGALSNPDVGTDLKSRTITRAVGFLDGLGAYIGMILRRHPTVRLVFALYVLLIHLWVAFVLYHFTHHESYATSRQAGLRPPGMG